MLKYCFIYSLHMYASNMYRDMFLIVKINMCNKHAYYAHEWSPKSVQPWKKFIEFIGYYNYNWLAVLISTERPICACHPDHHSLNCARRKITHPSQRCKRLLFSVPYGRDNIDVFHSSFFRPQSYYSCVLS